MGDAGPKLEPPFVSNINNLKDCKPPLISSTLDKSFRVDYSPVDIQQVSCHSVNHVVVHGCIGPSSLGSFAGLLAAFGTNTDQAIHRGKFG